MAARINYLIGVKSTATANNRSVDCIERNGKYLPESTVRAMCEVSRQYKQPVPESFWDQAFAEGANSCNDLIPPKIELTPAQLNQVWADAFPPQPTCPTTPKTFSPEPAKYGHFLMKVEPLPVYQLFGAKPDYFWIYYTPATADEEAVEREIARSLQLQKGLAALKAAIGVGIQTADMAARAMFDAFDTAEAAIEFVQNPNLNTGQNVAIAMVPFLPSAAKKLDEAADLSKKVDDLADVGKNTPAPNANTPASRGVWDTGPGPRGEAIEKQLGQNLPQNYPVLDKFNNGVGTSIKSLDLQAPTYSDPAAITRVGKGYIDKVASFVPKPWAGVDIKPSQLTSRDLDLAVPKCATAAQLEALEGLKAYGKTKGVTVNIIEVQ